MLEKVLEKVDFIIGREIEVGGVYKGTVTSIKEYGAFVEFNGGQTGLLHISELSHAPVARVADIISIGQLLSLKCIGQDLRGNIKLSLKETLRDRPVKSNDIDDSSLHIEESNLDFTLGDDMAKVKLLTDVEEFPEFPSSSPSIVIRSASECDEEEKSTKLILKNAKKLKKLQSENGDTKLPKKSINAKTLKLGSKVKAKVDQVRAHGLVLDLGGGLRGMYRFEAGARKEFEIGDELEVICTSFSSKGIPVMSILDNKQ